MTQCKIGHDGVELLCRCDHDQTGWTRGTDGMVEEFELLRERRCVDSAAQNDCAQRLLRKTTKVFQRVVGTNIEATPRGLDEKLTPRLDAVRDGARADEPLDKGSRAALGVEHPALDRLELACYRIDRVIAERGGGREPALLGHDVAGLGDERLEARHPSIEHPAGRDQVAPERTHLAGDEVDVPGHRPLDALLDHGNAGPL
jgi:hypothetical protein